MKFFTPDLYLQYNSGDEGTADRAEQLWDKGLVQYQRHLQRLRPGFTAGLRRLSKLCLHDAAVLTLVEQHDFAIIAVQLPQQSTVLLYRELWDDIRRTPTPADWPFAPAPVHWLYDEIDSETSASRRLRTRRFWHRILWSDGQVWEIPLADVLVTGIEASNQVEIPAPLVTGRRTTRRGLSA